MPIIKALLAKSIILCMKNRIVKAVIGTLERIKIMVLARNRLEKIGAIIVRLKVTAYCARRL